MKIETHEISNKNLLAQSLLRLKTRVVSVSCVFVLLIFSSALYGETLAKYREDVKDARGSIESLLYSDDDEQEGISPGEIKKYERDTVKEIRAAMPPTEKVEWRDSAVETDNRWLDDKLNDFEKEAQDSPKREAILTEIDERLCAIEKKLDELETPSASASTRNKSSLKFCGAKNIKNPNSRKKVSFSKCGANSKNGSTKNFRSPTFPCRLQTDLIRCLTFCR